MTRLAFTSRVGSDGIVTLRLPPEEADSEVRITVETISPTHQEIKREHWEDFIHSTQGTINDPTFRRAEQGSAEERHSL